MLYSVTMSLDGFIAGPGGDMSWLTEHRGPDPALDELVQRIGALLAGNRTFGGDDRDHHHRLPTLGPAPPRAALPVSGDGGGPGPGTGAHRSARA